MKTKYKDIAATLQVIGCVYKYPYLLEQQDKYFFHEDDFIEDLHKIAFGVAYNLRSLGSKKVDIPSVLNYLSHRPSKEATFKAHKGEEWLEKVIESASIHQFDYYYGRLRKMTLLRVYEGYGINLDFLYDPNNITDLKKKQQQEDWLDNASLEQISYAVTEKLDEARATFVDNTQESGYHAGDGVFDLIERLKETPEVGVPLYGNLINTITRGARLKKFYLRSAASGVGKAIPNYTIIPTPNGDKRVEEIKRGDYLFDRLGNPTKVLQTHPQKEQKQIYKVVLADGRVAECCSEHLWEYKVATHRGYTHRVETTQQIIDRTKLLKNGFKNSDNKGYRFQLPLSKAVKYSKKDFSVDPYVFGLLLGDGSFKYNKTNKALSFSSETEELPSAIAKILNCHHKKDGQNNYSYTFAFDGNLHKNLWVEEILKDYPELWNAYSYDKFIPNEYLYGSIKQRKALLAGLLDTDGSIDHKGRVTFSNSSKKLIDNMVVLCRSLGYITGVAEDTREKDTSSHYILRIQCNRNEKISLFRLKAKKERAIECAKKNTREELKEYVSIVDIQPTNQKTDMTCFTVDNEESLFLMNDFITTHNTRSMVADSCYIACNEMYNTATNKWESIGEGQPTLYITTEQEIDEVQSMMLAFVSGVNEESILTGDYGEGEEERVRYAAKILTDSPLFIEELPDFSMQDIENIIKKHIRENNVHYVFFDYIHTSMKIFAEITEKSGGVRLREDQILLMMAIRFKDLCNELGIFILTATQLNGKVNCHNTTYSA